jgi:hypothetical protein
VIVEYSLADGCSQRDHNNVKGGASYAPMGYLYVHDVLFHPEQLSGNGSDGCRTSERQRDPNRSAAALAKLVDDA